MFWSALDKNGLPSTNASYRNCTLSAKPLQAAAAELLATDVILKKILWAFDVEWCYVVFHWHPENCCCECWHCVPLLDHISSVKTTPLWLGRNELYAKSGQSDSHGWIWAQQKIVMYSAHCCLFCANGGLAVLWLSAGELIVAELKLGSSWSSVRVQDDLSPKPGLTGIKAFLICLIFIIGEFLWFKRIFPYSQGQVVGLLGNFQGRCKCTDHVGQI